MRIRVVSVGKIREPFLQSGVGEYLKRLKPYARVEMVGVPDEPAPEGASEALQEQIRTKEGERISRVLPQDHFVVVLDSRGEALSSERLAGFLAERALGGESNLAFVVGGSLGLSGEVLARANFRLSLGPMTYPHQMVPLLLLEQVYRSFKINRGEPYHK